MFGSVRVFLDFNLPNATTWFYFSLLLTIAMFFKFGRLFSIRNWDLVMLFLLAPGLLLVNSAREMPETPAQVPPQQAASLIANIATPGFPIAVGDFATNVRFGTDPLRWRWIGYLWLLCGSVYFFLRCLLDLAIVQRPALGPNLDFGGLAWMSIALMACLTAVAFRPDDRIEPTNRQREEVTPAKGQVGPESAWFGLARKWVMPPWWMTRGFAIACHLMVVLGLMLIGRIHFQDAASGMAAAALYLMLPYTGIYVGQIHHVLPSALVVWAFVLLRVPSLSAIFLGLATGAAYFPALVVPAWIGFYWRRGAGRFAFFYLMTAAVTIGLVLMSLHLENELESVWRQTLRQAAWQPWKAPTAEGFWTGIHGAYRLPVFIAFFAFVLLTPFWPAPKNLAHLLALTAAVFVGIQLWYGDQGGVYVLWYLPLLLLMTFRPNLQDVRPPTIDSNRDWASSLASLAARGVRRLVHRPAPQSTA
ncbi:MAG: hypothetical protein K2X38_10960 [Gemmataceae bacterium]|nr:hypothetical protein [Gemmataceae bacterium]